jgi:hypothetical protein
MVKIASKKLKLNKNFQPLSCDEGDEFYPNGIFEFNITKLLDFINANQDIFQPQEVEVNAVRKTYSSSNLNELTIQSANISAPIILAEISPDMFNVIDGHHRLEKAYRDGVTTILAYKILAEQHIRFLTSTMAYTEYVQYWNEKLKNWVKYNGNREVSLS